MLSELKSPALKSADTEVVSAGAVRTSVATQQQVHLPVDKALQEQSDIALALLQHSGDIAALIRACEVQGSPSINHGDKLVEAQILSEISKLENVQFNTEVWGEIKANLSTQPVSEYLQRTNNVEMLSGLLNAIAEHLSQGRMEVLSLLADDGIAQALRNNLDSHELKDTLKGIVSAGYVNALTLSENLEIAQQSFAQVDKWRDLINTTRLTQDVIKQLSLSNLADVQYVNFVLDKLSLVSDRATVSTMMHDAFASSGEYQALLQSARIDQPNAEIQSVLAMDVALSNYESSLQVGMADVENLAQRVCRAPQALARNEMAARLAIWFFNKQFEHARLVAEYEEGFLCNKELAASELARILTRLCKEKKWAHASKILQFPKWLLQYENPELSGVVSAYEITHAVERASNVSHGAKAQVTLPEESASPEATSEELAVESV